MAALDADLDEFLSSLAAERGLAANTLKAYRTDLTQYVEFVGDRSPDPAIVSAFVASLKERDLAPSTIARKVAAVRGLHRFRVAEGLADGDPTLLVESPRRPSALPKALGIDEVQHLLDLPNPAEPLGRRDAALLEFLYATGARVSEAVGIDVLDIDLDAGTARLTGKGNKQRIVPVGGHAVAALIRFLPDRGSLLRGRRDPGATFLNFRGGRLTRQGAWGIVRRYGLQAGIPAERLSPHVLRHSAATHMVEGGADLRTVQEMLGHASISTTQVYTRVSPRHLYEVYVACHPRSS